MLIKLGRKVDGRVSSDGDIVAFSTLCPHKGYPLGYVAADKTLNCPGLKSAAPAARSNFCSNACLTATDD